MLMRGFSLIEVLISLSLTSLSIIAMGFFITQTQQALTQTHQICMATQLLHNIQTEAHINRWNKSQFTEWETFAKAYLPNAALRITPPHIELAWKSNKPLHIQCASFDFNGGACIGI